MTADKRLVPNACHTVWYIYVGQMTEIVFVNRIISITCTLNDRKVIA